MSPAQMASTHCSLKFVSLKMAPAVGTVGRESVHSKPRGEGPSLPLFSPQVSQQSCPLIKFSNKRSELIPADGLTLPGRAKSRSAPPHTHTHALKHVIFPVICGVNWLRVCVCVCAPGIYGSRNITVYLACTKKEQPTEYLALGPQLCAHSWQKNRKDWSLWLQPYKIWLKDHYNLQFLEWESLSERTWPSLIFINK